MLLPLLLPTPMFFVTYHWVEVDTRYTSVQFTLLFSSCGSIKPAFLRIWITSYKKRESVLCFFLYLILDINESYGCLSIIFHCNQWNSSGLQETWTYHLVAGLTYKETWESLLRSRGEQYSLYLISLLLHSTKSFLVNEAMIIQCCSSCLDHNLGIW